MHHQTNRLMGLAWLWTKLSKVCTMKAETKLWLSLKKNTPKISWTRLESWASFGVPDLLGYDDSCGFFMLELKVTKTHKVSFSPHQKLFHMTKTKRNFIIVEQSPKGSPRSIKLYGSNAIHGLLVDSRETPCLAASTNRLLFSESNKSLGWLARSRTG